MRIGLAAAAVLAICLFGGGRLWSEETTARAPPEVLHIQLQDAAITPVAAMYIERALREAEKGNVECVILELDTPGGLLTSTQRIVKDILASPVPVVVYVSPAGSGRAASAGLFITLSSHVAAMAPGTRIGAAHPVQLGGRDVSTEPVVEPIEKSEKSKDKNSAKPSSAMEEKLVEDTKAWAEGLAAMRNRNPEWAILAVTESRSITASEALEKGVIDLVATDLTDLLAQLDGHSVVLQMGTPQERTVQLRTDDAQVRTLEMWWGERLLAIISNPNVALLLMMFGVYGIMYEMYSPGWGISGTLGVICLVLAFFGLSVLPVNYAGLALIAVALALFAAEAFVTSYGSLTVGGIVCLILGGLMLVDSPTGFMRVSLGTLVPIAVATAGIVVFLVTSVVRAQQMRVQTGSEAMLGMPATAGEDFSVVAGQYKGPVFARGEIWQAVCGQPVAAGEKLKIQDRHGLTLVVGAADPGQAKQSI